MSTCSICAKPSTQPLKDHSLYTAIEQKSEIKTGFKQSENRTRTFDPQLHQLPVCPSCQRKFGVLLPGVILIGAVLLGAWFSTTDFMRDSGILITVLCFWLPLLSGAIYLISEFFGLDSKLKKIAVKQREATNWKGSPMRLMENDSRYLRADRTDQVIGLTQEEFEKKFKKR